MDTSVVEQLSALVSEESRAAKGELGALSAGCGVYDLAARARIAFTGGDRVRWLNGMITNNVRDLKLGQGVYAFLLNPQGRILGDLNAFNSGDKIIAATDQSQVAKLLEVFDKYIIMDDVEVSDVTAESTYVGIAGPQSHETLRKAGLEVPTLEPLQFAEVGFGERNVTVLRGDNPAVDSYEFWADPGDALAIKKALIEAGATPVGEVAVELLRVASGMPRYGRDIRERDLPQETEQARALHFSKGCYVGQEIVERIRSRGQVHRKFTGFHVQGPLPQPETKIQHEGKDVGEITSVASLPTLNGELNVALGYIRREVGLPGREFKVGNSTLTVATLPFARAFGDKT